MSMDNALQEIADFGQLQSALERIAELERVNAELRRDADLYRQWFDNVQDINPKYLETDDYMAARRLYESLGMRVPSSIDAAINKEYCSG